MAAGNSVHDEIREQHKKAFATMSRKEKFAYFWDYYKIHTIAVIFVIVCAVSFIRQMQANKPYAFYAAFINSVFGLEDETSEILENEFQEYAGIDPEAYQVCIDTSLSFSASGGSQYEMANRQKLVAMMNAGDIHVIIADTEAFDGYARAETFYDLSTLLTKEELTAYADLFYYTDAAAFDADTPGTLTEMEAAERAYYAMVVDHGDPSSMEKPIPVGIRIPASGNKLADAGYYDYLRDDSQKFQGYPAEPVFGIPLSVKDPQLALQFLAYLTVVPAASD